MEIEYDVPRRGSGITPSEIRDLVGVSPFLIEIGCNDGEDTASLLNVMPNAHIVCFEPEPRALARFMLRDDPRVTLYECGVGHRCGNMPFWASTGKIPNSQAPCKDDWDYSGSFSLPTGHLERDWHVQFKPPVTHLVVTLDHYWDEYQHPVDLVWADTQGSEAKVILGGQHTLLTTRYLYIEYYDAPQYAREPDLKGIMSFLPDFDLVAIYGENALLKNRLMG